MEPLPGSVEDGPLEVFVRDGECPGASGGFPMLPQYANAEAVECADVRHRGRAGQRHSKACGHLRGGLVCEGQGEYMVRRDAAGCDEVPHALGEHACFARTGAGQNQRGADGKADGLLLRWVEGEAISARFRWVC